jgi:parallel beta-helix repeat protein
MDQRFCRSSVLHTPPLMALLLALSVGCTTDKLTDPASSANSETPDLKRKGNQPGASTVGIAISPDTAVLEPQQVQQFAATAQMSDGTTSPIAVTWSATAGTIDSSGLFTAGAGGDGKVIATAAAVGKADTAAVTVATSTAVVSSCVGTPLYPSDDWASKVAGAAAGTTFCVQPGIHRKARNVVPKSGMRFLGAGYRTAILDGADTARFAFQNNAASASNVVIKYLVIRHYRPATSTEGAINGYNGIAWRVDSNEIAYSAQRGVNVGRKWHVGWNYIHHSSYMGLGSYHGDSTVIEGNHFAFNPPAYVAEDPATSGASQMKIFKTVGAVVRNNLIEDGGTKGIWYDTDNYLSVIEGNRVLRHGEAGIWYEINYDGVIRNNTVTTCGTANNSGWIANAGIQVTNSQLVQIYGNRVSGCENGIIGMAANSTSGDYYTGARGVKALGMDVHDNTVTQPTGKIGVGSYPAGSSADTVFTNGRIRWNRNTYNLTGNSLPFAWRNAGKTRLQWQGFGFDINGAFTP